jgi:hypothetical protein
MTVLGRIICLLLSIGKNIIVFDMVYDNAGVLLEPALLLLPGDLLLLPPLGPQPARSCSLLQQDPQERKPKLFASYYFYFILLFINNGLKSQTQKMQSDSSEILKG